MLSALLVVFATAVGLVSAQTSNTTDFTTCCQINPASEQPDTLLSWCRAQTNTCPLLCTNGQTASNTCNTTTLEYNCTCLTGTTPNISAYSETLPSLECDAWVGQCTAAHPNDLTGQTFCQSFVCGKLNASAIGAGISTSSAAGGSATASASNAASSTSGSAAAASSSKGAAPAGPIYYGGREIGTVLVITVLATVFGLAL